MAPPIDPQATPAELPPENPDQFLSSLPSQTLDKPKEPEPKNESFLPEENPDKFLASLPSSKKPEKQPQQAAPVDPEIQKKQEFRTKAESVLTKQSYKPSFDIPAEQLAWGQQSDPKNVKLEYEETHPDPQHTLQKQKLSPTDDFRKDILMRLASGEEIPGATEQQRVEAQKLRDSIDTDKPLNRGSYLTNYNTPLAPEQQDAYKKYIASLPAPLRNDKDYDLPGYWLKYGQHEDPKKPGEHMTDEFKKPNHITFSNESIYHNEHDGFGAKQQGGKWYNYNGTTLYQPSAAMLHDPDKIKALQAHIAQAKQAGDPDGDVQLVSEAPQGAIPNVLAHEDAESFLASLPSQQNRAAKQTFMQVLSQYDPNNLPPEAQSLVSGLKDPKEIQSMIEMGIMPDRNQIEILKNSRDKNSIVGSFVDNLSQGNIGAAEGDWLRGLGLLATGAYQEGAVPLMRGINQIVYHDLPGYQMYLNPTFYTNTLGITNQPLPEDQMQLTRDIRGIPGSFVSTAEQIRNTIAQSEGGGIEALDNFLVKHGFRTPEQALNNEVSRTAFKVNDARAHRENESSLGRGMAEGGVLRPYAVKAAELGHQLIGPSIPQIWAEHPELNGDYDKAAEIQAKMAKIKADETVKGWIADNELNAPNPDVEFVESLAMPGGNIFAVAGDLYKLGKLGTAVASDAIKTQRVNSFLANRRVPVEWSPEIQAKLNRAEDIRATRPGIAEQVVNKLGLPKSVDWTAPARGLANIQDKVTDWVSLNVPKPLLHAAAPYAAGAAAGGLYGAITNPEHPIQGAITDIGTAELAALAWKFPRIISDIGEGAKIGGKIGWAEGALARPETDKVTRFLLEPKLNIRFPGAEKAKGIPIGLPGKGWDWIGRNVVEWGKLGVEPLPLTIAMGTLQSADNDEIMKTYGQGLMFAGSHKIMSAIKGENPYKSQLRRKQDDERIKLAMKDAEPETVDTLNKATNWNSVIRAQKSLYQDVLARAEKVRTDKGEDSPEYQEALGQVKRSADQLFAVQTAGAATRREYNRQVLLAFTNLHEKANGVLRAGQRNVGIHVMTLDQIADQFLKNNRQLIQNGNVDEARNIIKGLFLNKDGEQSVAGVRYMPNGGLTLPDWVDPSIFGGAKHLVFDPLKPSAVINADAVMLRGAIHGHSLIDVLNHEGGHLLYRLPEFREANAKVEELLFGQGFASPDGTFTVVKPGVYTPEKLFDMYSSRYMKDRPEEEQKAIATQAGIWDDVNNRLNFGKTVNYMKEEVLADVSANSLRKELSDDQDGMLTHMRNWAKLNSDSSRFARLTQKIVGLGGPDYSGRISSPALGLEFSPEVMYAQKQATDALANLYGNLTFDMDEADVGTKMTKATILGNKKLLDRYGKDSGLVKTEMQANVTDANGNPIQTGVKISNPASPAGTWIVGEDGKPVQKRGYGPLPDELQGKTFAPGTVIEINSQVVYHPDGVTPVVNKTGDIKKLLRARGDLIRKAMSEAYDGTPGSFNPFSEDQLSFKGTFSPAQIKAIQNLPENIIPLSIKEKILRLNALIAEGQGRHAVIDFSTHINERGQYVSSAPKIRDIIPLSMGLSKDGNFYVTTISWDRMLNKLALWQQRMPGRLSLWNGDAKAFITEFRDKYLSNIQQDIPNKTGLDEDPKISEQKRNVFQDFINIVRNDSRSLNPDRTSVPLTRGEKRKATDYDNVVRSFRADAIMDLMEHPDDSHLHPIDYGKIMGNLMPAKDLAAQDRLGYESDLNDYTKTHRYDDKLTPIHGFRSLRDSQEGAGILQGDRLLQGVVDSLRDAHRASEQADAASEQNPASAQRLGLFSASGLREQEKAALVQYAKKNGLLNDYDAFTRAFLNVPQGKQPIRGAEHEVVIGDPVIKRSQAGLNNDYLHYSDRMIAHALTFPESAPKFSGVQVDPRSGGVYIETKQPYLPDSGEIVPEDAKRAYMMDRGFYTVTPASSEATSFYNPESGVHVDDLHNGNIIMTYGIDGNPRVAVIDPQIRATTNNRWDTELRQQVFQNNPELRDRMLNPSSLPTPRENRGNVRKMPVGRMGIDLAGMEEVPAFGKVSDTIARAKAALQQLREGGSMLPAKIEREVGKNKDFLALPSEEAAKDALDVRKKRLFGAARDVKKGHPVALRIDIPSFNRTGNYVVTVHEEGTPANPAGDVIGYDTMARVDNPTFSVGPRVSLIYEGKSDKFPVATVNGTFNPSRKIPKDINNWTPVGFDPKEHSFFYDKANDEMVIGGDEAISVGNTVFVKNPVYGDTESAAFMPAKKLDEAHASAIESGDIKEAQRLVDEKARQAGYDIGPVYHYGVFNKDVNKIPDTKKFGMHFGTEQASVDRAIHLDEDTNITNGEFTKAYLKGKFLRKKDVGGGWSYEIPKAIKKGYDGIVYKNEVEDVGSDSYIIFNPEQAKSADPATYDDEGKLIPLSQRFDLSKQDIRFMPAKKLTDKFTTLEVAPDPKDKAATAAWNKFNEASKRRVTEKVGNDLLPKLAKDMKLPKPKLKHVIGGFMQETNPSIIVEFPDSVPYEKQQEFAKVAGHLLKQNAVITFDENNKTDDQTFFVGVVPSRKLTYDETSSLYKQINTAMPEAGGFTGKEDKLVFGNFSDLSNEEFYAKLKPVLEAAEKSVDYGLTATEHTFRSNYIETDTAEKALTDTYYGKLQESGTGGKIVRRQGDIDSLRTFATKSVRGAITEENKRIKRYAETPDAAGLQKLIDDAKARALVNIAGITAEPLLVRSNYEQLASGKIKYKDVVEKSITDQPLVVAPMPNLAVAKSPQALGNKNVGTYKPGRYQKDLGDRISQGAARIAADPQILADPTGYAEYMRDMGVTGDILTPPSALKMLLETPDQTLALLQGGYHGEKTVPGTKEAAIQGLDGVMDMRNILAGKGPTPLVTALHHFWGTLSKQLPPIQQEALWMRLISNPEVMEQIQKSIDGTFDLTKEQWGQVVQRAKASNQGNFGKFGNNATANANSFHLMLKNHNGKWGQVADVYTHDDSVDMRNAFWGLGHGSTGIKNKVQSFIGLTFGIPSNILDRWRFVSLNLPMLMDMHGSKTPGEYFTYSGRNKTVPEDRLGVYKNYGTVENGNVPLSIALYSGLDRAVQAGINNHAPLRAYLGAHANPGGFHWIDWNAIKNEAVGHSSLDITKTFLQQYGRNGDASDFLRHLGKSTVFTEGENKGKMVRLTMQNGVFSLE